MNQTGFPLVSLVLWLPTLGALALALVPRGQVQLQRSVALAFALAAFAASLPLYFLFSPQQGGFQFVESLPWVPAWGIGYNLAVDGVSLWLVLLTTFLTPIVLLTTWGEETGDARTYQALLLLLATGLTGVFVAQDLLLFYVFFEFTLIPTALLIGVFGGPGRVRAATKFFLYPFFGSLFMLVGIIWLYLLHGQDTGLYTFDYRAILASMQVGQLQLSQLEERLLFAAFFAGFAVKVPIWPFHTWMPDAHAEAPNSGAVDVAGMLVKIGAYGLIRFNLQLFPAASVWAAPAIAVLAVVGILYAALVAYAQTDMKRMLAYASVSHLGFIVLGIFAFNPQGISGALVQMVNSGVTTGALFLIVGMLYARRGSRALGAFGGVWKAAPALGSLALVMVLGAVGLPGLNGFVGEFAIMQGAWISSVIGFGYVTAAVLGVIFAAVYLLRMYKLAFMGDTTPETAAFPDLRPREALILALLLLPTVAIGVYPNLLLAPMQGTVQQIAGQLSLVVASR
ncbi:MAG TPA: NADH-quinone oxidoreductase subunit M [Roseiflexaceae bacterium]|nr:NADH-quinone oxidoreductase subunit M [Roseiflexaceae bacterium]